MTSWCILRTAGRSTLRLAETLGADGFEVWTPVETKVIVIPSCNVKRTVRLPILESFVFADYDRHEELCAMSHMDHRPRRGSGLLLPAHPGFSVMKIAHRVATVRDEGLAAVRALETKRTARAPAARTFKKGATVKVGDHKSFGGMVGIVRQSDDMMTLVCFDRWFDRVEIPTSILSDDGAYTLRSATDADALAA